jgi:hypothetical protein
MSRSKRKYDPLVKAKPIEGDQCGIVGGYNTMIDDVKTQQRAQDAVCMHELLQEYGITEEEDQWFWLALELAREYVPGFQMEVGPRGRQKKWTREKLRQFYDDVQDKMKSSGKDNESWACKQLTRKYGMKHAALLTQYKKAKQEFTQ